MPPQRGLTEAFRTRRLLAQRLDARHLDQVVRLRADPEVMQWLGGVADPEDTAAWLAERVDPHWREHGYGMFALFEKQAPCAADGGGRELAGYAGLVHVADDVGDALGEPGAVELCYAIIPSCWGQGYATEIGRTLTGLALTSLDLRGVVAYTTPDNAASRRVLEKLGYAYERELEHEGLPHALYRIVRAGEASRPISP